MLCHAGRPLLYEGRSMASMLVCAVSAGGAWESAMNVDITLPLAIQGIGGETPQAHREVSV